MPKRLPSSSHVRSLEFWGGRRKEVTRINPGLLRCTESQE